MEVKNFIREYDKELEKYIQFVKKDVAFWNVRAKKSLAHKEIFQLYRDQCRYNKKKYDNLLNEILYHLDYASESFKAYKLTKAIEEGYETKMSYIKFVQALKDISK